MSVILAEARKVVSMIVNLNDIKDLSQAMILQIKRIDIPIDLGDSKIQEHS